MISFYKLILSFILVVFAANVLEGENVYKATEDEELFGTWLLVEFTALTPPKKVTYKLGSYDGYYPADAKEPMWTATYIISDKWTDAKGNIWYKTRWQIASINGGFMLYKISDAGETLETINSQWEYPKKIDSSNDYYRKYKRK